MTEETTVLDTIVASLHRAGRFNPEDQVAPTVILWTDNERQWEPLVSRLQQRLPELLVLGEYQPDKRQGPAIWLRCAIARKLPEIGIPDDAVPIVYLPGISRQELRAVEDCAKALQPLAELQYRGVFWTQVSTKDWTVCALLKSQHGGLGLDVARDRATKAALLRALNRLVEQPVAQLQGRRIDEQFLNGLLTPDPARDLLEWLNHPDQIRRTWPSDKWAAFSITCRQTYRFDPDNDVPLNAAERLGRREGPWRAVWDRFAAAATLYPAVPDWLRKARPSKKSGTITFAEDREPWPQDNEELEAELRAALVDLADKPTAKAREAIIQLENTHGMRRGWPWAKFGWSPLAGALEHLAALAESTKVALTGQDLDALAKTYTQQGWRTDAAVLDALACVERSEDHTALAAAIRSLYEPWLADGAGCFQNLVAGDRSQVREAPAGPYSGKEDRSQPRDASSAKLPNGCCLLFADGLRFDVAQRVLAEIGHHGWEIETAWTWSASPSVTATAKPAVSPVAGLLDGDPTESEFRPRVKADDKALTHDRFKRLLTDQGIQFLADGETGDPKGRAWTECGSIDRTGHREGVKLARRIAEEVRALTDRIRQLLDAGWKEVRVTTDHGWLLMPGNLPKVEMAKYLTETRWGRCAIVREGSHVDVPQIPWGWNSQVYIAVATGIGVFRAGLEYDHGGLSLQECLIPSLTIRKPIVEWMGKIESLTWRGLRCRVEVAGAAATWQIDLRTVVGDATSSLTGTHPVENGKASLLVTDDGKIGVPAVAVLLTPDGQVIAKRSTLVGGEE
jgi:hypothetical protein